MDMKLSQRAAKWLAGNRGIIEIDSLADLQAMPKPASGVNAIGVVEIRTAKGNLIRRPI